MVIETGVSLYRFAKGEMSGEQLAEHLGQSGTSTLSSMYAGAAAGAVFGPVGAVVGSMAGYLVASSVYQSSMAILRSARLAQAEADRLEAICREAVAEMHRQRAEFERLVEQRLNARRQEFAACFALVDAGTRSGEPSRAVEGLANLAAIFGQKLQFASFAEFDRFMKESDEPLRF